MTTPSPPPTACLNPRALETIELKTDGIIVKFFARTNNATRTYATAITGTMYSTARAILFTPPNIIIAVAAEIATPKYFLLISKAFSNANDTVFACTELNISPNVIDISIEKTTPIHLLPKAFSI